MQIFHNLGQRNAVLFFLHFHKRSFSFYLVFCLIPFRIRVSRSKRAQKDVRICNTPLTVGHLDTRIAVPFVPRIIVRGDVLSAEMSPRRPCGIRKDLHLYGRTAFDVNSLFGLGDMNRRCSGTAADRIEILSADNIPTYIITFSFSDCNSKTEK